jgi:thiopeptide-type bacteriocin biosynthesis protein
VIHAPNAAAQHLSSAYSLEQLPNVQAVAPLAVILRPGIRLARQAAPLPISLGEALNARRSQRDFTAQPVPLHALSAWLSVASSQGASADAPRTYPSAGGLYPTRLHLLVRNVEPLPSGLYTYQPGDHSLVRLEADSTALDERLKTMLGVDTLEHGLGAAGAYAFVSADLECSQRKYGARAYRFVLQESGHLAQNLLLASAGLGLAALPLGSYLDDQAEAILGLGGTAESVLYVIALGAHARDRDPLEAAAQRSMQREASRRAEGWQQWRLETPDPQALLGGGLGARLEALRRSGVVGAWWYLVKSDGAPHLRLRVQPGADTLEPELTAQLRAVFEALGRDRLLDRFEAGVYEPERFLFGGDTGLALTHAFFDLDSRFALYAAGTRSDHASLAWTALLLREAGLDPFEHWDVWQRVLELRPAAPLERLRSMIQGVRRLVRGEADALRDDLTRHSSELERLVRVELPALGQALREAQRSGRLHRGLRELLSVWIVFHWNRLLFTGTFQSRLAQLLAEAWNPD